MGPTGEAKNGFETNKRNTFLGRHKLNFTV